MFQDDGSSSSVTSTPAQSGMGYPWLKELKSEERGLCLIHLLLTCAKHVASANFEHANIALDQISHLASPQGDTMQRIASYFAQALANRMLKTWPGIYKALHSTKVSFASDNTLVRKMFFDYFPYLKIAFVITNQAIIEAMEGEKMVHVVDLNAAEPTQWCALVRDLSARPEGPPHLRITGVHQQKEVLDQMARVLTEEAEKLDIPFQFNPIVSKLENLDVEKLNVKTGEALAISSVLQFHSLLAPDGEVVKSNSNSKGVNLHRVFHVNQKDLVNGYSPSQDTASSSPLSGTITSTKIEGFLNALRGLSPKVMVIAEQDSDHNKPSLMERLSESLYFYAALFDCLESSLPRTSMERLKVEKMLFGEEIKNIISCEGGERKERHEKLDKWAQRLDLAGFWCAPLSYYALLQSRRLLQGYSCDGCRLKEENGCVVMCWQDRPLFSVSAWKCQR
ncbi:putative transcription factor GRAS family [Helianthus annuus]|uniref:Transcription factor GRAS family n=1 Tax=Helianthus annuus TaxID=4232 RepID=A0A9K3IV86_HELAN|nr:scarecrow-like protein 3 [Helianthus annuus]KAF5803489.1 putative transcription factor GRAS family [Helianthus annuus]KAJ0574488.1 putative transcription factor GRAS family [Helianthus annuus]KAJ0738818.1 putative transcription factor GRAS family [Helianthus annuus]KAJ0741696.1 putative transcription factor GRAS family [Helianthus annuus]KAJ0781214.1 putative transcription factor GRAS family [Helianthus annuus]